ncbi:hypothetical protein [Selenomonas ruminantium]|uniref:hypothetical protein n=1 Tax=Selenomonas ruminantium TaxID=971 RepID=UPI00068C037A|nr:hypothetical protein [Selenomonas ruminantium]
MLSKRLKEIKIAVCLVLMSALLLCSNTVSEANQYPDYLNGDRNWVLVNAKQGMAWYMDKSSVAVQKYAPPNYQIAVNVVTVSLSSNGFELDLINSPRVYETETHYYYYNWDSRKMYRLDTMANKWNYMPPVGDYASTSHVIEGELAFYAAYHMKFYGGKQWMDSATNRYETAVSDSAYMLLDAY